MISRFYSADLRPTQLTNLTLLVLAILSSVRLQIAFLSRALPLPIAFHHRQKRLLRFIGNHRINPPSFFIHLLDMILMLRPAVHNLLTVVIDQTDLPMGFQGLVASVPYRHRALPFAFFVFDDKSIAGSQNQLENEFFDLVVNLLKLRQLRPILLLDRGYADVKIMQYLRKLGAHFVIRTPKCVQIELPGYVGKASGFDQEGTWHRVLYQQHEREPVNLVTFTGKGRDGKLELIFLVSDLDPRRARKRYQERMHIEEGFKDIKSPLGLNHLRLKRDIAVRLSRLLVAVAIAVIITAYLHDEALAAAGQVTRKSTDQSFVSLFVLVWRVVWFSRTPEYG